MTSSGLDTVALSYSGEGGSQLLSVIQGHPDQVPSARGVLITAPTRAGMRVTAWPDYGVVKVEGRLGALLDGDRKSYRLVHRRELAAADEAARAELVALLGAAPHRATAAAVSRFDLAVERSYEDGAEGLAVLRAMRALCPPGYKVKSFAAADGRTESVTIVTAQRAAARFRTYDKGVESGSHQPGERIRFEAQNRVRKSDRHEPDTLATLDLGRHFGRHLAPFLTSSGSLTVTHSTSVVDELVQKVARGDLSMARAERLAGSVEIMRRYGRAIYDSNDASGRRLRALREVGVAVDDALPEGSRVPVSELLDGLVAEFTA